MPVKKTNRTTRSASISQDKAKATQPLLRKGDELLKANPSLADIFDKGKTEIYLLIVADGDINFTESQFGLSELINKALKTSEVPWEKLTIVKAHRSNNKNTGADVLCFKFDEKPRRPYNHPLKYYDQIWLFGYEGEKDKDGKPNKKYILSDSELRELATFMNNGGGVFATGDHEDLGAALCGKVPRVGSMRKWFLKDSPPPKDNERRIDTLREGIDEGFLTNDQADNIPQEIRPIFKLNEAQDNSAPHALLRNGNFAITVLPDHMHEGECVIPKDLKAEIKLNDGTRFKEYPPRRGSDERLSPEVVAISTSAGGYVDQLDFAPPVLPRCYNVIVAYDGHQAGRANNKYEKDRVGRVVVDSSFHHFVDINLRGTGSDDELKVGLYDDADKPTRDYLAIKQYYINLVLWLCPPEKQASYYLNMLLAVRYLSPLIEEIRPIKSPRWEDLMFAGRVTWRAIAERFSRTDATRCALFAAGAFSGDLKTGLDMLFEPWEASAPTYGQVYTLFNLNLILRLLLGGAMLGIAARLPESSCDAHAFLAKGAARQEQLRNSISDGLHQATAALAQVTPQAHNMLKGFLKTLDTLT